MFLKRRLELNGNVNSTEMSEKSVKALTLRNKFSTLSNNDHDESEGENT